MFADPQSVTIAGQAKSMPRIAVGDGNSTFRTADETVQMRISHRASKGRTRRMVRLDQTVIAADPLTAEQDYQTAGVYVVVDEPKVGFTDQALIDVLTALVTWLSASTYANAVKVLGSET